MVTDKVPREACLRGASPRRRPRRSRRRHGTTSGSYPKRMFDHPPRATSSLGEFIIRSPPTGKKNEKCLHSFTNFDIFFSKVDITPKYNKNPEVYNATFYVSSVEFRN